MAISDDILRVMQKRFGMGREFLAAWICYLCRQYLTVQITGIDDNLHIVFKHNTVIFSVNSAVLSSEINLRADALVAVVKQKTGQVVKIQCVAKV